ncbi:M48 family metallopeptidase [Cyanobium sp. Alchichica 3B3-8F6]|uniref:M48 family metallopeptidase n=1 Tax=Cyanobium sp. Alchichica 3B3-8F6 TaxID=2823696 RepID=UPI0020CBE25A|nr:SprT family zinc-dependent metalloprotease [Cyanobium sp. Alchichica 3B3-8F6]MCP9882828.1 M48 family metallopeptidase [Cyanobium sp. Alchichica 3B3-8F6]
MTAIPEEVLGLRVEVVRSIRRTAALHIVGSDLQVRIPEHLEDERVAAILKQKRPWIRGKVAELKRVPPHRSKELVSGESFPYLGRHYRLKVQEGHQVGVYLSGGYLKATIRPSEHGEQREARIQQYLQSWYRTSALERLQEKTNRYAQQIGVSPTGLSVRNFRSRWGSCDKRGQVVFNWNIIKAPHSIVDYVVIHELCHLIHPNHSKDFWQLVGRHDTNYNEHRQWLRTHSKDLITQT